jgi:hypothetical protein
MAPTEAQIQARVTCLVWSIGVMECWNKDPIEHAISACYKLRVSSYGLKN